MLKLRKNAKYGVASPTSMGVRITPPGGMPVHSGNTYIMQATSAESNVVSVPAALGIKGLVLTNFVKDSPISYFIKSELGRRNIDYLGPDIEQGGPWGYRHQFNIADSGFGPRGPRVHNDRAGEVGRVLSIKDFDTERIFGADGVQILHLSGLVAAISEDTTKFCMDAMRAAKEHGTLISFDMNHRKSFWEGREQELRRDFDIMAGMADILIGNEEDYQLCLGVAGPEKGGSDLAAQIDGFKEMTGRIRQAYPDAAVFGNTLREVVSAGEHLWGAITLFCGDSPQDDEWTVIEPRPIKVLDRIGGGDGFAGGLLYGILKEMTPERATQFGWGAGAYAVTVLEDYAAPASEDMIWDIVSGNARIKR